MIRAMGKILYSRLETDRLLEKIQYVSDFKAQSLLKHGKRADRYRFKNTKRVSLQGTMVVVYRPVSFCSVHRLGSTCHKCKSSIVVHGKPNIWQLLPWNVWKYIQGLNKDYLNILLVARRKSVVAFPQLPRTERGNPCHCDWIGKKLRTKKATTKKTEKTANDNQLQNSAYTCLSGKCTSTTQ